MARLAHTWDCRKTRHDNQTHIFFSLHYLTMVKALNKKASTVLALITLFLLAGCIQQPPTGQAVAPTPKPAESLKWGVLLPLTGDLAEIGGNARIALELAVNEINQQGGIDGQTVELIIEDTRCNPQAAATAAQKLVNVDRVPVIFGEACSGATLAAAPIANAGKTVLFSPCSTSPDVTNAGDFVFRDVPSDAFQGKIAAEFAFNQLKKKKAAVLYSQNDYAIALQKVFSDTFSSLGGQIVDTEQISDKARDVRTELTKIKNANPDLVYVVAYTDATVIILQQAHELGLTVQFLGPDAWDDPAIPKRADETANGAIYLKPKTLDPPAFKQKIEANGGKTTLCAPQIYDAAKIVAASMKKAGSTGEALKNELYAVQNYQGVSAVISFDDHGDLKTAEYAYYTYQNGETKPYSPQ